MANKDLVSEEVLQELINKLEEIVNNYCWNLEYFTPTDIEGFFDGTQQEIDYYSSLIKDDVVSKNFLHSSKQIADDIAQSILEANEYTDSLLKNISSIQLEWCATNLPTTGENNKIYILPVTSGSGSTKVNTLNIWNNTSNDWVSIGNLEIDITQFYNKTEIDTKMDLKANKTEVVANDKIVQTLDSTTNSSDTILSTSGLQVEMDKKANDDEVIKKTDIKTTLDENSTNDDVYGGKAIFNAIKNNSGASYSTNEQLIGGTWIDGKPIYRKVIVSTFGLSGGSDKKITLSNFGVNNVETPISCTFISDNGGTVAIRNEGGVYASFFIDAITVHTMSGWTLSSGTQKIIIEYTKTTDV